MNFLVPILVVLCFVSYVLGMDKGYTTAIDFAIQEEVIMDNGKIYDVTDSGKTYPLKAEGNK